jgi:four helix bundle protein
VKDFKKLKIWQLAMEITDKVYDIVEQLPSEEKFGLRSQVTRSAISVAANIAEGSAKSSERDYKRFIEISLGSAFELETHVIAISRRKWVKQDLIDELLRMIATEQRMISKFLDKL